MLSPSLKETFFDSDLTLKQKSAFFLATLGGAGFSPKAPGTVGSLVALLLYIPISYVPPLVQVLLILIFTVGGIYASNIVGQVSGREDDQRIVVDELSGMWITLMLFPLNFWLYAAGFALFRVLDIVKIFPANYCDEKIEKGLGVMLDDVVSGIYAHVLIRTGLHLSGLL